MLLTKQRADSDPKIKYSSVWIRRWELGLGKGTSVNCNCCFLSSSDSLSRALGNLLLLWTNVIFVRCIPASLLPAQKSHLRYSLLLQPQGWEEGRKETRERGQDIQVTSKMGRDRNTRECGRVFLCVCRWGRWCQTVKCWLSLWEVGRKTLTALDISHEPHCRCSFYMGSPWAPKTGEVPRNHLGSSASLVQESCLG